MASTCFLFLLVIVSVVNCLWQPTPSTTWTWQLQGTINTGKNVAVYDIDLFDAPVNTINQLKAAGKKIICYFSAGSYEEWRSDANTFPASVKGKNLDGWPGERWLDIRQIQTLGPIMSARLDLAKQKGCDCVEPDNVDAYTYGTSGTGFPLSYDDQRKYNIWLSQRAHERNLCIALKNDLSQIGDLLQYFDCAVNEQCWQYKECDKLLPFINANKAVFNCEYGTKPNCTQAIQKKISSIQATLDLDGTNMKMCNAQGQLVSF
ncbi:unnamed protein product [Rotaria sordida]|uniref:Glycoside-hydrolase family GH114 TIM-barrel domain-containing protein n=1 Tax=Rotaria sordida TaxID=392033 RepID=A0A816DC87_9BILA|nr:unnamed protein product [Rotaria sordida]CAF1632523.1 unnamed protein product [Rotaria sordida]